MFSFLSDQSVVDGINERVEHLVGERVGRIPTKFEERKGDIVHEIRRAAPNDHRGLNLRDYPDKNERQVNGLAIHDVTSNETKHQIAREIYAEVDPTIAEKTAGRNKFVRIATKKAVHFAVRQAVNRAVGTVQTRLEQQYGIDSKNTANSNSRK